MDFVPLHNHSHYSLLDGLSKPTQMANRCVELGYKACALTDHGSLAGAVSFQKACKKKKIKPILGCEFYITEQSATVQARSNPVSHLVVLAKNLAGWKSLIRATSKANDPDHYFNGRPRLDRNLLREFAGNFIAFSGHMGSCLANAIFTDYRKAYSAKTEEQAKSYAHGDWSKRVMKLAEEYRDIFGKENFFIEIPEFDRDNSPTTRVINLGLRYVAKKLGIPCVASDDAHYASPADAPDQRILLCTAFKTNLQEVERKIENDEEVALGAFFNSSKFFIPDIKDIAQYHTEEEIANTVKIADMCEEYDISGRPTIPNFDCPGGISPEQYLKDLCDRGWEEKIAGKIPFDQLDIYSDRLKKELNVINKAKILPSYFLIVHDYCNWYSNQGWLLGPGRGSGAGCLVSYLIGITSLDPIENGLFFERFYNDGRNTVDHVSLPDIDCDFQIEKRDSVKDYVKQKYGYKRVGEMITFSRMQGRSSITDVLRARGEDSFEEIKRISKPIPDEAEISDELQLMKEAGKEPSIIRWTLENDAKALKEWCWINEKGELEGPKKRDFEQAIRLEGTKKQSGKHAAGIVIAKEDLENICPMVYDEHSGRVIAGMEMSDLESIGCVKFDILGIAVLDKLMSVQEELNGNCISMSNR